MRSIPRIAGAACLAMLSGCAVGPGWARRVVHRARSEDGAWGALFALRRLLLAGSIAALLGSCSIPRTIELPRIAGQVVDARSSDPVEGAEVFVDYTLTSHGFGQAVDYSYASRWTTTDAKGQFSFDPIRFRSSREATLDDPLGINLVHPRYGSIAIDRPDSRDAWGSLVLRISPDTRTLGTMKDPRLGISPVCGFASLDPPAYMRCCEVAYGPDHEECLRLRRLHP